MLTKTKVKDNDECSKKVWLDTFQPKEKTDISSIYGKFGDMVAVEVRKSLYPNGIFIPVDKSLEERASLTKKAIEAGENVIYEASFIFNDIFIAVDILFINNDNTFTVKEIKSTSSLEDRPKKLDFLIDLAIQVYVIENATGLKTINNKIIYLNKEYRIDNDLPLFLEFFDEEIYLEASTGVKILKAGPSKKRENIVELINNARNTLLLESAPKKITGSHCTNLFCPFLSDCKKNEPIDTIFELNGVDINQKQKLLDLKQYYIKDMEPDFKIDGKEIFKTLQGKIKPSYRQVLSYKEAGTYIERSKVEERIKNLIFPIAYLDFETVSLPIPVWKDQAPNEIVVAQYSLDIEDIHHEVAHFDYILNSQYDDRKNLTVKMLRELQEANTIIVYHKSFEESKLKDLARLFPDLNDKIARVIEKIVDLEEIVKDNMYLNAFRGSFSIKKVLPALCPSFEESYKKLEVQNGSEALNALYEILFNNNDNEKARKNLLDYCALDSLAMLKIIEVLRTI